MGVWKWMSLILLVGTLTVCSEPPVRMDEGHPLLPQPVPDNQTMGEKCVMSQSCL